MPEQKLANQPDEAVILSRLAQVCSDPCRVLDTAVFSTFND